MPKDCNHLAVDGKKMWRAKESVMSTSKTSLKNRMEECPIGGIFFDGKNDKHTKVQLYDDETERYYPGEVSEEHYSVTWEPSGKYLFHYTPEKPQKGEKPAMMISNGIYSWLQEHGATEDLVMIRGDSTSTNTGPAGGAIHYLEVRLGYKCHWLICLIHINELPFRHLMIKLDGKYIPKSGWTGPIGKLIEKINTMIINPTFPALADTNDIREIPSEIADKLSTDQKNCYKLIMAIKTGKISPELANVKCGELSTARWLTTGQALLMLWMCDHGLTGEVLRILEVLVRFCIDVYFKLYYDIKVKHTIKDAPLHLVHALELLEQQSGEVQDIIRDVVIRGAYSAHSENLLASLICSESKEDREFAVNQILQIRDGKEEGDRSVRIRRNPNIIMSAHTPVELIDWKKETVLEPVFTCKMSITEIKEMINTPFNMEPYSTHTQSCERAVQEVNKASEAVYGHDRRDGWVRARVDHREMLPVFRSKRDIIKMMVNQSEL